MRVEPTRECRPMKIDLYGMTFDGPGVTYYLWSPWRCSALEHRLFESIKALPNVEFEKAADELRLNITDSKVYRAWRWMVEADSDPHGYDHTGEKASVWAFLRLSLDRANPGEGERGEDIDLNGFGFRVWRSDEVA